MNFIITLVKSWHSWHQFGNVTIIQYITTLPQIHFQCFDYFYCFSILPHSTIFEFLGYQRCEECQSLYSINRTKYFEDNENISKQKDSDHDWRRHTQLGCCCCCFFNAEDCFLCLICDAKMFFWPNLKTSNLAPTPNKRQETICFLKSYRF